MAHEIESIAYQGATPWHGLGTQVDEAVGRDYRRFIVEAGLDWAVERIPVVTSDKQEGTNGYAAIRRVSDSKVLGVVGPKYVPLQNEKAFEWFEPFLVAGQASLHTAGSLRGGSRVWVLAKLQGDPLVIKGNDVVEKYLLLAHAHDGSLAIRVGFTPIRVVCANTLAIAKNHEASQLIRVRHTKSTNDSLLALRDTIDAINAEFAATAEQYRLLASKDINQNDIYKYIKLVFDIEERKNKDTDEFELTHQAAKLVDDVTARIEAGIGNDVAGVRGTFWAAYNGVTEYLSYGRGREQDGRLNSLWFGEGANLNQKALDVAVELATA
jgi:phage/plasmid-like protein (TIGR03299 family)